MGPGHCEEKTGPVWYLAQTSVKKSMIVSHEFRLHVEKNASYKMIFCAHKYNNIKYNTIDCTFNLLLFESKGWFNIKAHET